jgi:hypothetical protein
MIAEIVVVLGEQYGSGCIVAGGCTQECVIIHLCKIIFLFTPEWTMNGRCHLQCWN